MLKIYKSFVDGLGEDPEDTSIVQAVIDLARAQHLKVVAEGIETTAQLSQLNDLGCEFGQGYYFAKPLSGDEAEKPLMRGIA